MTIVTMWLAYAALATPVFAGVFLWALRCGQFRGQDRARGLALEATPAVEPGPMDRRAWTAAVAPILVVGALVVMMACALWIGAAHPGGGAADARP